MADLTDTEPPITSVLRELRIDAGMPLALLERTTGINRGRLSILERGVLPTRTELRKIHDAIDAHWLKAAKR
jgi:transcriptional regulator with XRE-family HTH domain